MDGDGIREMAGSPVPALLDGQTYLLGPWTLQDSGVIEHLVLRGRKKPHEALASLLPGLEERAQDKLLELAYRDELRGARATKEEMLEFLSSDFGETVRLWLMLRHNHPEISMERAAQLRERALEAVSEAIKENGEPLGNSPAPDQAGATANEIASPGAASSAI